MVRMSRVSGPLKVLAALLMLPGLAWAEHQAGHTRQSGTATALTQPKIRYQDSRWARYIASPYETPVGFSTKNKETQAKQNYTKFIWNTPENLEECSSSMDSGELSLGDRIGLFGKLASNQLPGYSFSALNTAEGQQQLDRTYEVGMSVRANSVMSLLLQWNLYAQGNDSSLPNLDNLVKEPWKDRNALGAGIRFGF